MKRLIEDVTELTEEEKDILLLVDGENDVSTIIDISGRDDFSVSKTLVSLIEKGVIEQKEVLPVIAKVPFIETKKAVILLSGGIDSSTTLAIAKSEGYKVYALSFDYNQRHKRELDSARMVALTLGAQKHLIIQFDLREIGGSALTSEIEVPKTIMKDELGGIKNETVETSSFILHPSSFIPVTYVPARNTIFLSFALAWAEVLEAENIFIGANAVDYSGYPDCRPEYLKAFEDMANLATKASVEGRLKFIIRAPLISLKKSEIIRKGVELGLDYALTWSCYDPQPVKVKSEKLKVKSFKEKNSKLKTQNSKLIPCEKCDSCIFRAKGFKEAGIRDPLLKP